ARRGPRRVGAPPPHVPRRGRPGRAGVAAGARAVGEPGQPRATARSAPRRGRDPPRLRRRRAQPSPRRARREPAARLGPRLRRLGRGSGARPRPGRAHGLPSRGTPSAPRRPDERALPPAPRRPRRGAARRPRRGGLRRLPVRHALAPLPRAPELKSALKSAGAPLSCHLRPRPSMLLVVDVGNTNTVLGVYDHDTLLADWRIETNKN